MWTYVQRTGELIDAAGEVFRGNYAGLDSGKNNPAMQREKNIGPLPVGRYTISAPFNHPKLGPYCLRLLPFSANEMYGRSDFLFHGDNPMKLGKASNGCIIAQRAVREKVGKSGDKTLRVVAERGDV